MNIKKIQDEIKREGFKGWLLCDFMGSDELALKILSFSKDMIKKRRWFYLICADGEPRKLVHGIEKGCLDHLPGNKSVYVGWKELESGLKDILKGVDIVAMNYSPNNAIPYISKVDAGTVELVRSFGVNVVSAADLIQAFEAVLTKEDIQSHLEAAKSLRAVIDRSFAHIGGLLDKKGSTDEMEIYDFILKEYEREGLEDEEHPIVAVNEHAGDPHYGPTPEKSMKIGRNDLVLLDVFTRKKGRDSIFADYTWVGYTGKKVPSKILEVFEVVREARDRAFRFVYDAVKSGREIYGYEVDDTARKFIEGKGYGKYFIHRTGHSIGRKCHGNGVNMDNLETRDERKIIPGLCFSIEPGIYMEDFGIRLEIDVYIDGGEAKISGLPVQEKIVLIG